MAQVGLNITKEITAYNQTISLGFWRPGGRLVVDQDKNRIEVEMRGYADMAYFIANGKNSYYPDASIFLVLQYTAATWPFNPLAPSVDLRTQLFSEIKTKCTQTEDANGNEINGGLDWSTATDATYP